MFPKPLDKGPIHVVTPNKSGGLSKIWSIWSIWLLEPEINTVKIQIQFSFSVRTRNSAYQIVNDLGRMVK